MTGYAEFDMDGWPAGCHRGMPGEALTLVICLGTPLTVRRDGHADLRAAVTVGGLRSGPVGIVHDGTQRGIQVDVTPLGARALLGRPAATLAEGVWPLGDVIGRRADELTGRLVGSGGSASIGSIASEVGLGRRHLGQIVRAELGLTPKTVARVMRFGRARRCLLSGRTTTLAQTAASCGYFDQAHMTNDWRRLAGCTPGEWMAQEVPFLQDGDSGRDGC